MDSTLFNEFAEKPPVVFKIEKVPSNWEPRPLHQMMEKPDRRGPHGVCNCCGTKIPQLSFEEAFEKAKAERDDKGAMKHMNAMAHGYEECDLCAGDHPGTPGVPEPKLGEEWESGSGERVRVIQEYGGRYKSGPYGGWAMGITSDGRQLGIRRGNVENGRWRPFSGPASTVNAVLGL